MAPEKIFIHFKMLSVSFILSSPKHRLRKNHQEAEPEKTPPTIAAAPDMLSGWDPRPRPAKMAEKLIMVIGLVRVRKKTEVKAMARAVAERGLPEVLKFPGGEIMVFIPRYRRKVPPIILKYRAFWINRDDIEVMPAAATIP